MSKVNQIQQELHSLGGGEFQKLADGYLVEKGIGRINSIGSVVAANKVKAGTPDTLVATPSGNYIFAEHTTQKSGLYNKMKGDLKKCFDERKTAVPIEKIERVIFCFTGKLDTEEEDKLAEICLEEGVNLDLFGIDALAFDLYIKYPGLARDFLGVQIDTGQIVSLDQFVNLYNSSKLATRLDLDFHFREVEIDQILDSLEEERLLILSGRPGVGKSRLALEACQRFFEVHQEYEILCVFGRNRDLWNDLKVRFSRPGHFLIFVDDANRVSSFEYVVDLLQHHREDQQIKVVATVRDYALTKIRDAARPLGGGVELVLNHFSDEQIKELVRNEYGISNYQYLERITNIARGNARLAVMAAEVAKDGPLSSIYDASDLYDSYFSSIREDLSGDGTDLRSTDFLQVAAIVSFFKAVDRTSDEMMNAIVEAFDITPAVFWESANQLHEMEVLDIYENEVVRISDQVLGTYLFYLAVFKEEILDFGALLCHFFPKLRHRIIDSINPVLSAFKSDRIIDAMYPHVERVWVELQSAGDEIGFLHLLDTFWFTKRTDTLVWIRDHIEELESNESVEIASISFAKDSNAVSSPSILSVLRQFAFVEEYDVRMALDLLLRYLAKRPLKAPILIRILIDDYGFRPNSYLRRFEVQRAVVDALWSRVEEGDPLFSRVFLTVAKNYLGTQFENNEMKDDGVLQITNFELPVTPELVTLRELIWQRLFTLYKYEELRENLFEVIRQYNTSLLRGVNSEIVKSDAEHVLPFLESVLDPSNYQHCSTMHTYINLLENHSAKVPEDLQERYQNDTYTLAEILLPERGERKELDLSYEEYEQYKRDRLKEYTANYTFDGYVHFIERCLEIQGAPDENRNEYQLQWGVVNTLLSLAERDLDLYIRVLKHYLNQEDPLRLRGYALVQKLVEQRGYDETLQHLCNSEYPTKRKWLFHVHEVLPVENVDDKVLNHLYNLYEAAEQADLPHRMDYLLKYLSLDTRVVAKVVSIVLKKAEKDPRISYALSMLFNPHTEVVKRLSELFSRDFDLLKRAYLVVEGTQHHGDYSGQVFDRLLDLDPDFITEFISWKYTNTEHGWLSSYNDNRNYNFIWARQNHQEIMNRVVDIVFIHEKEQFISIDPYLKTFFLSSRDDGEADGEVQERQDAYLLRLIDERSEDTDFMVHIFSVISQFAPERRRRFVERFVHRNTSPKAFRSLPLEPSNWSYIGSEVPLLQGRINYWESLLPIMNTVDLLPHKQYVEHCIQGLRTQIEGEKKSDFIGD